MAIATRQATADVEPDPHAGAVAVWFRRAFLILLAAVVIVGAFDLLGVRSRTATARSSDGSVTMSVQYAQIARAGLDVPFQVTIHRNGGFSGNVVLAVSSSYLGLFDRNGIDPQPSSATTSDSNTIWVFDPPPGDTLVVSFDMSVQGGRHWGRSGTVTALDDEGHRLVRAHIRTWLSP